MKQPTLYHIDFKSELEFGQNLPAYIAKLAKPSIATSNGGLSTIDCYSARTVSKLLRSALDSIARRFGDITNANGRKILLSIGAHDLFSKNDAKLHSVGQVIRTNAALLRTIATKHLITEQCGYFCMYGRMLYMPIVKYVPCNRCDTYYVKKSDHILDGHCKYITSTKDVDTETMVPVRTLVAGLSRDDDVEIKISEVESSISKLGKHLSFIPSRYDACVPESVARIIKSYYREELPSDMTLAQTIAAML
jgi:hypothetical protein